jgi:AraC-like DNA-binding protein
MQKHFEIQLSLPSHRVRVPDLARVAGVSSRTVYRVFDRLYGDSPLRHLRRASLEGVRARLEAARPGDSVTRAAFESGFDHLGRFAAAYRRQFGEVPSQTLRRARSSRAASPSS